MDYIIMEDMYESMSSGKVDKYLVQTGDKVKKGQPVAEIIAEGYWTLTAIGSGYIGDVFIEEGEYVEVGTPLMEIDIQEADTD
tara:strand:+ start:374 stop:622 length:249 start_codon:yes stop_codon:yes gene_type:complete